MSRDEHYGTVRSGTHEGEHRKYHQPLMDLRAFAKYYSTGDKQPKQRGEFDRAVQAAKCCELVLSTSMCGGFEPRGISGYHRSEEHTSELQSRGLISYAVFCLKKKK